MKTNLLFKILSLALLTVDVIFAIFFLISFILISINIWVFGNLHLIFAISVLTLNVICFIFTIIKLKLHKK